MPEWIVPFLLLPAILVAVALLVGFVGCDRVFGLTRPPETQPAIDSAVGKDGRTITLTWHWAGAPQNYEFERTDSNGAVVFFDAPSPATPIDDTNLEPAASYQYRVRGVYSSGDPSGWSPSVTGTTLPLQSTYSKILTEDGPTNFQGYTLVQRIEPSHLAATGPYVRITVHASSPTDALIDKLYISQHDATGKAYDSAADLTAVYDAATNQQQPFVVLAGTTRSLPIVAYTINRFQALLIAVDFRASSSSGLKLASQVPATEAISYYLAPPAGEAAVRVRSPNFVTAVDPMGNSAVVFITNIEAG